MNKIKSSINASCVHKKNPAAALNCNRIFSQILRQAASRLAQDDTEGETSIQSPRAIKTRGNLSD